MYRAFLVAILSLSAAALYAADATVTINSAAQYQTILGWGASSWNPPWVTQALREEIIKEAVNDLGLNRLRFGPPSGNRSNERSWEWLNDNGDPYDINWSAFNTAAVDERVSQMIMPFKQRVEANGEPFDIYLSPSFFNGGSSGEVPAWLRYSPGEYAEHALAILLYLRDTHGIEADYYCILNEPGNNNPFSASLVADMIKVLGPSMRVLGFTTDIEFPECISAQVSWNYIQSAQNDDEMWSWVSVVTYHLYGTNDPYRSYIRDFAVSRGLPTGQTEYMGLTMDHLYDDFTLGGVSYWEIYGIGSQFEWNYNKFGRKGQYWNFRQVMHYARPGAVRIEAISDNPAVRSLAFQQGGSTMVVLINGSGSRTVDIVNLPSGTYGVCQSVGAAAYQELGLQTVGGGDTLTLNLQSNTVMTIYAYGGANQPPTPTRWEASSDYLTMPADSTVLLASATDPELDSISYLWTVASQPPGANVVLSTPDAPSTAATGLTAAGDYFFNVAISDSANVVNREVRLTVFSGNQPPVPVDVHNRIPVMVTLPTDSTFLRGGGWDLEGDPLAYQWAVLSQPPGANVLLTSASTTNCKASNMTVDGDYVFQMELSDPGHTVADTLVVPVYPVNAGPAIVSISASPETLVLPRDSTYLSAITFDPDGDTITHWWSVTSCPAGARPILATPGYANTMARDLDSTGIYTFRMTVIDRKNFTTGEVTVFVLPGTAVEEEARSQIPICRSQLFPNYPNPFGAGGTTISFNVKRSTLHVSLSVYDVAGRLVRTLAESEQEPGVHSVVWDGRDGKGRPLPGGLYFYQLRVPSSGVREVRKMVLLK